MQQKQGFSLFSWVLALFCLPSALWPLALLVSPKFSDSVVLTSAQINGFSIIFWVYPLVLLLLSGGLYKLHKIRPTIAWLGLLLGFMLFYSVLWYIIRSV